MAVFSFPCPFASCQFIEKRRAMKQEGRTEAELAESYCFLFPDKTRVGLLAEPVSHTTWRLWLNEVVSGSYFNFKDISGECTSVHSELQTCKGRVHLETAQGTLRFPGPHFENKSFKTFEVGKGPLTLRPITITEKKSFSIETIGSLRYRQIYLRSQWNCDSDFFPRYSYSYRSQCEWP